MFCCDSPRGLGSGAPHLDEDIKSLFFYFLNEFQNEFKQVNSIYVGPD